MNVAVIGLGLIGGSIGLAARARAGAAVSGYDPDARALERALECGAVDSAASSLAEAATGADVVFVAAPVQELGDAVLSALRSAPEGCVVTDVGSVKRPLLGAVAGAGGDSRFIGGHPLAGSEKGGIEHADERLFETAAWFLVGGTHGAGRDRVRALIESFGGRPVEIDPESHDRLMARVSHLPHVFANLLVESAFAALERGATAGSRVAGPSFRDATRVAGASTSIWPGIYIANADMLVEAIDDAIVALQKIKETVLAGDHEALAEWNELARAHREALPA